MDLFFNFIAKDVFPLITTYLLPLIITITMTLFLLYRNRYDRELRDITQHLNFEKKIEETYDDNIEKLILRGDVELRVLEEICDTSKQRFFYSYGRKSEREIALEQIKKDLRNILRKTVDSENFQEIKGRIVSLLDQIKEELKEIRRKKPFDGLEDPERSLLIDLLEEISPEKEIPRQKAHQLADILKLKHQDIKALQVENAKSAGWTRWGTVGTVSFGLLSLALSIYTIYK